jgi:hypothetical protein
VFGAGKDYQKLDFYSRKRKMPLSFEEIDYLKERR